MAHPGIQGRILPAFRYEAVKARAAVRDWG